MAAASNAQVLSLVVAGWLPILLDAAVKGVEILVVAATATERTDGIGRRPPPGLARCGRLFTRIADRVPCVSKIARPATVAQPKRRDGRVAGGTDLAGVGSRRSGA